jgi:hypothetical protein
MVGTLLHFEKKKKEKKRQRRRYNAELPDVHSSPDIIGIMKGKLMCTAQGGKRNAYTILVRKP